MVTDTAIVNLVLATESSLWAGYHIYGESDGELTYPILLKASFQQACGEP